MRLKWNTPRAAASIPLDLDLQSTSLSIDGIVLGPAPGMPLGSRPMFVGFNGATGFEQPLESLLASGLAEGPHELQYRMTYLVRSGANQPVPLIVEMRAPWTLVPATENTVTLRADEKLRRIIEDRIVVEDLYRPSDRDQRMNATIAVDHLPIAVAFDVLFRYGGREYPLGTVSFDADQRSGLHAEGPVDDLRPRRGDIVLRPSEAAARRTIGIETIWDGEIIVRNVPIRVTATQPQPTTVH